jgi:nitrogenase molybdenum-iron protein alpha/beta subunit
VAAKNDAEKRMKEFYSKKKAIVIDPSSVTRVSIRKFLVECGMENNSVEQADNINDAEKQIIEKKIEIVFCDYQINNRSAFELLSKHLPYMSG